MREWRSERRIGDTGGDVASGISGRPGSDRLPRLSDQCKSKIRATLPISGIEDEISKSAKYSILSICCPAAVSILKTGVLRLENGGASGLEIRPIE